MPDEAPKNICMIERLGEGVMMKCLVQWKLDPNVFLTHPVAVIVMLFCFWSVS